MALSHDLISEFVKITKDDTKTVKEATVYGTVVTQDGDNTYYVRLDGSDVLTPIITTAHIEKDERVTVKIKNHKAMITGNITSPSASSKVVDVIGKDLENLTGEYEIFKGIVADDALIDELKANNATIGDLIAEKADISELNAANAQIEDLKAKNVTIDGKLVANEAAISKLQTDKLDVNTANATYATITNLASTNAAIKNLEANKANVKDLEATNAEITNLRTKYANIDFANIGEAAFKKIFSESGLIRDIVVGNGTITGELVGVTIKGDLIEGNTIKADKLVVKGSDGLYYKLNFEGGTFKDGEQVPTDSLHGSVITAKSITAEKVSVNDLVAFDATIGGFKIGSNAIHSAVKESVNNTTRGIYFDNDGQMNVGDNSNFFKYFKDTDGKYKLIVSADVVRFGSSNKNLEDTFGDYTTKDEFDSLEIGGRNLIKNSDFSKGTSKWKIESNITADVEEDSTFGHCLKLTSSVKGSSTCRVYPHTAENFIHTGGTYSLSFYAKAGLRNFIDRNGELIDTYVIADGTIINCESSYQSATMANTIAIEAGETYTFSKDDPATNYAFRWAWYDANMTVIGRTYINDNVYNWTAPENAVYVRISYPYIEGSNPRFERVIDDANYSDTTIQTNVGGGTSIVKNHALTTEWQRYTFTYDAYGNSITFWPEAANSTIYLTKVKVEKGDKCTDWTPAPEDTDSDIEHANNSITELESKLSSAQSVIEKLEDAISMLVTDEDGTTLLQQTDKGWTFNMANLQDTVVGVSESLNSLTNEVGDVDNTVNTLKNMVNELRDIAEYVDIGTHQDIPPHLHIESTYVGDSFCRIYYQTSLFTHATNTTYTLSFRARSSNAGTILESCVGGNYNYNTYILSTDWQEFIVTYTTNSGGSLTFWLDKANTDADIADIKLVQSGSSESLLNKDASSSIDYWVNTNMNVFRAVQGTNVEPCIELGEADSDFKLMITNTRIMFREGSKIPTYINTRGLITKNLGVEEEFNHGGFVWAKRTNGNYGLSWRGDDG